jgi:hypothetical protein
VKEVPIIFNYQGKTYHAELSPVHGAGGNYGDDWNLMINHFYNGHLFYNHHYDSWVFKSQTGKFEELANYFEAYMAGWFGA